MNQIKTITVMEAIILALIVFSLSFLASSLYHFKDLL